jgi:light-harvesting complex I chlorophyll a/b binding protein 1
LKLSHTFSSTTRTQATRKKQQIDTTFFFWIRLKANISEQMKLSTISVTSPVLANLPLAFAWSSANCGRVSFSSSSTQNRIPDPFDVKKRLHWRHTGTALYSSEYDDDDQDSGFLDDNMNDEEDDEEFLKKELARLESLEDLLEDIEVDSEFNDLWEEDEVLAEKDIETNVEDIFSLLDEDGEEDEDISTELLDSTELEKALLEGVVPVSADVGSECLPGDWGFDPLNFASRDYILCFQYNVLQNLPGAEKEPPPPPRPSALILRDYREAEIRHGRLAMLAAIFWPLQEMLDRLLLDEDQFGTIVYDTVTLPYFPLLMTLIMMLLGYLDIFAKQIQEQDNIGDAFLPGDCFWDPLKILQGAPPSMKRNMQERELFNGRMAMLAVAAYLFEELASGVPIIEIEGNQLLFVPAYEIPFIQEWLDAQFIPTFEI